MHTLVCYEKNTKCVIQTAAKPKHGMLYKSVCWMKALLNAFKSLGPGRCGSDFKYMIFMQQTKQEKQPLRPTAINTIDT